MKSGKSQLVVKIIFLFLALSAVFLLKNSSFNTAAFNFFDKTPEVKAGTDENVTGWAWSSNIGWISFNSRNCDTDGDGAIEVADNPPVGCQAVGTAIPSYGVNIDSSGDFTGTAGDSAGLAWSNNIGWISFKRISVCDRNHAMPCADCSTCPGGCGAGGCNLINPPFPPYNTGGGIMAHYNPLTREMSGWGYVLALGDNGWLKLKRDATDPGTPPNYGVTAQINGRLLGWAWNGNGEQDTGIGWVSFSCDNESSCASSNYFVRVPWALSIDVTSVAPYSLVPCDSCSCLAINWTVDSGSDQDGFNIYENGGATPVIANLLPGVRSYVRTGLARGTTYNYRVEAYKGAFSVSDTGSGTTNAICSITSGGSITVNGVCGDGVNPPRIELAWTLPASSCVIDHYEVARCQCDNYACNNCPDFDINPVPLLYSTVDSGDCNQPTTNQCTDTFNDSDKNKYFRYIIRSHCNVGNVYSDWSQASPKNDNRPCSNSPMWEEERVN